MLFVAVAACYARGKCVIQGDSRRGLKGLSPLAKILANFGGISAPKFLHYFWFSKYSEFASNVLYRIF